MNSSCAHDAAGTPPHDAQERCYAHLYRAILSGGLQPGGRLVAGRIAQELGMSRTPVREALVRLAHAGLVRKDGGWGFVVAGIDPRHVLDLYEIREALEVKASRQCLEALDEAGLARIEALLERSARSLAAGSVSRFLNDSRELHMTLVEGSGNRLLLEMLRGIDDRIRMLANLLSARNPDRPAEVLQENRRIVAALRARDAAALRQAIEAHLRSSLASTLHHLTRWRMS